MNILIGLIAIIGAALFWYYRTKAMREAAADMTDGVDDIRLKIRRLINRRKYDTHPADSVDDARLAASGLVIAIATMDAPLSQAEINTLSREAQETFGVTEREALDIVSYGRWVSGECGTAEEAVRRLVRRIDDLAGPEAGPDLVRMIETVATADGKPLGEFETEALATVRRVLGGD
ncbi:MAG: TerB family tellurite resistance protein [Pseudomonadota bacterium]